MEKIKKIINSNYKLLIVFVNCDIFLSRCGEYWFLVPPANLTLDKQLPDHQVTILCRSYHHQVIMMRWSKDNGDDDYFAFQVLLLVDKEEDERNSAVVVYVPTSHVLLHEVITCALHILWLLAVVSVPPAMSHSKR